MNLIHLFNLLSTCHCVCDGVGSCNDVNNIVHAKHYLDESPKAGQVRSQSSCLEEGMLERYHGHHC